MGISDRLKEYRSQKGLSQKKMAESLGISPALYGRIERGDAQPSPQVLEKLMAVLGTRALGGRPEEDEQAKAKRTEEEMARMKARDEQIKREAEEALARVQREAENAAIRGKLELALEARKGPAVMIQSEHDEVSLENVYRQVWKVEPRAEKIYVKPGENRAYWTYQDQAGWVWLW